MATVGFKGLSSDPSSMMPVVLYNETILVLIMEGAGWLICVQCYWDVVLWFHPFVCGCSHKLWMLLIIKMTNYCYFMFIVAVNGVDNAVSDVSERDEWRESFKRWLMWLEFSWDVSRNWSTSLCDSVGGWRRGNDMSWRVGRRNVVDGRTEGGLKQL